MSSRRYLSKTKIMAGRQCPKRLWLDVHAHEKAEDSEATKRAFKTGDEVGRIAQKIWPDGILIGHDQDLGEALRETTEHLEGEKPVTLFEGTVSANGVLIRADVLTRDDNGEVQLVEVKASTSVNPHYIDDCAIQAWVLEQSGLVLTSVQLAHVNSQFVYAGNGDYNGLLELADVSERVRERVDEIPNFVSGLRPMLAEQEPSITVGRHCHQPYDCPFLSYCTPPQPPYPVTALPGGRGVHEPLLADGIESILDVPAGRLTNKKAEWARAVTVAGEPELRPEAAIELKGLGWPRYYFDFETVSFAVPIWAGTRPYQALPFQWSCHVEYEDGSVAHHEFLADADADAPPMRDCAEGLIKVLGEEGPILVYTLYEKGVLKDLAGRFPDLAPQLEVVVERLYDLHPVTRANYYHPDMMGSWSLKKVLAAVAPEEAHSRLDGCVQDGGAASEAFSDLLDPDLPAERHKYLRQSLLKYCKRDTLGLVRLAHFLAGTIHP